MKNVKLLIENSFNIDSDEEDPVVYIYKEFQRCANYPYNVQRMPNEKDRFIDWLKGQPGVFDVTDYTKVIVNLIVNEWEIPGRHDYDDMDNVDLYYQMIYDEFIDMYQKSVII